MDWHFYIDNCRNFWNLINAMSFVQEKRMSQTFDLFSAYQIAI